MRSLSRKKTGSGSAMEVRSRPLASMALLGITILTPGTLLYRPSTHQLCVLPSWPPAPSLPRKTMGQPHCPPDMYSILGALLRIWSAATRLKDQLMNSTMGRSPPMAAAMAMPVKPFSLMGVSMTRLGPNSSSMPWLTLYAPLYSATSSPSRKTRFVLAHGLAHGLAEGLAELDDAITLARRQVGLGGELGHAEILDRRDG